MMKTRALRIALAIAAVTALLVVGCKGKDQKVADDLREHVLTKVEAAKDDADALKKACREAEMALEAPDIKTQAKANPKGATAEVVAALKKVCVPIWAGDKMSDDLEKALFD